jgi:hypothetical protein
LKTSLRHTHTHTHTHTYIHRPIHTHTQFLARCLLHKPTFKPAHTLTHIHPYTHTHTPVHTHRHTHRHTHQLWSVPECTHSPVLTTATCFQSARTHSLKNSHTHSKHTWTHTHTQNTHGRTHTLTHREVCVGLHVSFHTRQGPIRALRVHPTHSARSLDLQCHDLPLHNLDKDTKSVCVCVCVCVRTGVCLSRVSLFL